MDGFFTRDGHLTELTINRLLVGELNGVPEIEAHLAECEMCRDALAAARAFDAQVTLRPPVSSAGRASAGRWPMYTTVVAMAAAVALFALRPDAGSDGIGPPPDEFRIKGGFDFQVFAHNGQASRALHSGAKVHPGERLGFRFGAKQTGHLLVVGTDGRSEPYLCYPQNNAGTSAEMAAEAIPRDLEQAVRLDDVLGSEAIVALHCDAPLAFADVTAAFAKAPSGEGTFPTVRADCRQRVIRLSKVPQKAP